MYRFVTAIALSSVCLFAQAPAAAPPKEDPVAIIIDGRPFREAELESLVKALPENVTRSFYADKKAWLDQYAMMLRLVKIAEKEGIDKEYPHAQRLEYNRMQYLVQMAFNQKNLSIPVSQEDMQKYYEAHKGDFGEAKVKMIYVAYNDKPAPSSDPAAKKPLTSEQAEKRAAEIVAKLKSGADFAEMVKQYSDDEESKAKGGDFPVLRPNDNSVPPNIKAAVFALKPGQVSDPVKQANGFYVFRLESTDVSPLEKVRDDVFNRIKDEQIRAWLDGLRKDIKIEVKDEAYLKTKGPR